MMRRHAAAIAIGAISLGCAKEVPTIKCGPGTELKGDICVISATSVASTGQKAAAVVAPVALPTAPTTLQATPELSCSDGCKRAVTCRGGVATAPIVQTHCNSECAAFEKGPAGPLHDLVACRSVVTCDKIEACVTTYQQRLAADARPPAATDPVTIAKAGTRTGDYGIGMDLTVSYKNVAEKVIDGIKFQYFCSNNFDEPVANGRMIDQEKVAPNKAKSGTWHIYHDTCTKVKVVVADVHFADGSTWVP